ncbi:MAG: hypothetical protein AVDCRST_MAG50-2508 [uncultured Acidimicrobiales bacterium]|uniref:Tetratricopeptide repeat protein n=1 Tax=uncultured Acidimicrobiales bacterium TaxID=310071 RepID=A0A6J4IFE0_9ACTN|nr:MAG: hypothetical protein AVDCRST_MAG50-2508 [uncultured Acidimicrobiales bacterium]
MTRTTTVVLVTLLALTVPGCARDGGVEAGGGLQATPPSLAVDPASTSPTDQDILRIQTKLSARPADPTARLELAYAFLQKARETGDPSLYTKADALLTDLAASPEGKTNPGVLVAQGTLSLARHRFEDALDLGRRAVVAAPGNASALGVVVDASNELGRYDEAVEATQAMADARPSLPALARVSYARELRGDLAGAITAMAQAVGAGAGTGENLAYAQVQLGHLLLTSGDLAAAETAYAAAARSFPGSALPDAGRARVLVAQGNPSDAADLLAGVVQQLPIAEHAIAHGEALAAAGRRSEADSAFELVRAIAKLDKANGVNTDLEMALFEADHGRPSEAVKVARTALKGRPGIYGRDALAWALFRDGKVDEASIEARKATVLGTRDPSLRFHAAVIADAKGDRQAATEHLTVVLATNPAFSAHHGPAVRSLAARLGLAAPQTPVAVVAAPVVPARPIRAG